MMATTPSRSSRDTTLKGARLLLMTRVGVETPFLVGPRKLDVGGAGAECSLLAGRFARNETARLLRGLRLGLVAPLFWKKKCQSCMGKQ